MIRPIRRRFRPNSESLERRALLAASPNFGQWPLRATDPASSILVRFNDLSSPTDRQKVINAVQGYINADLVDGPSVLNLGQGVDLASALESIRANPAVTYAVPNRLLGVDSIPNDPSFSQQWGSNQSSDVDVNAPQAWDVTTGSTSTIIAVIDTGLDVSHPEFAGRLWVNPKAGTDGYTGDVNGYNFGDNNSDLTDAVGHGTHVTGIIAATGNNGVGVAGINWNAKIMPLRYYGVNGGYLSSAIQAIYFAADHGARVINASWGTPVADPALANAISYANSKGAVFVSAAGNSSVNIDTNPFYPASYRGPNTITVASIDPSGALSGFSNYGPLSVDVAAPGAGIYSTLPGGYGILSGTSMAAPVVTGIASLVVGQHPDWTPAQIVQRILSTTKSDPALVGKVATGGIIDAAAAVGSIPLVSSIRILDGSTDVLAGSSTLAFGNSTVGSPLIKTLTIVDQGTAPLVLGTPLALPTGFSLVSSFGAATLAPGASTTLVIRLDAAAAATYSGVLTFGTNDPLHSTVQITMSGTTTAAVSLPAVQYLDDASSSFTTTGSWNSGGYSGYYGPNNTVHFTQSIQLVGGSPAPTATWATTVTPGTYRISANWTANSNHSPGAPYTVYDSSTAVGTALLNQIPDPVSLSDAGVKWQDLGTFTVSSSNLSVVLRASSSSSGTYAIADAIRVEKVG